MQLTRVSQFLFLYLLGNYVASASATSSSQRLRGSAQTLKPSSLGIKKPNFVLMMSDDLRAVDMQPYAIDPLNLPNIQKLAAQSVAFNTYTVYPVCGPSRNAMLTGNLNCLTFDCIYYQGGYSGFPENLRSNSKYYVGAFGKIDHYYPKDLKLQVRYIMNGSDVLNMPISAGNNDCPNNYLGCTLPAQKLTDTQVTQNALAFLSDAKTKLDQQQIENFLLMVGWHHTHIEIASELYTPAYYSLAAPNMDMPQIATNGCPALAHKSCASEIGKYRLGGPVKGKKIISGKVKSLEGLAKFPRTVQYMRGLYFDSQAHIDINVGLVLNKLSALGFDQNTYVILTADHGWMAGEKNGWCKGMLYEEAMKIPLFIRAPQNPDQTYTNGGTTATTLASNIDIAPTILSAALGTQWLQNYRHPNGKPISGKSLLPALSNTATIINAEVFSSYGRCQPPTQIQTNPCTSDTVRNSCDRPYLQYMGHSVVVQVNGETCQYVGWWPFTEVRIQGAACAKPSWDGQPAQLASYGYISPQIDLDASYTELTVSPIQEELYCYPSSTKYGDPNHPNIVNLALAPNQSQQQIIAAAKSAIVSTFARLAM